MVFYYVFLVFHIIMLYMSVHCVYEGRRSVQWAAVCPPLA